MTGERIDGYICGGHFITALARGLGLLTAQIVASLTVVDEEPEDIGYDSFKGMRVIRKKRGGEEDTYELWREEGRAEPAGEAQDPMTVLARDMRELHVAAHMQSNMMLWQQDNSMEFYRRHNFSYSPPPTPTWDMHGHYRQHPSWTGEPPTYTPHFGIYASQQPPESGTGPGADTDMQGDMGDDE